MRQHQEDTNAFNTHFKSGKFSHSRRVLEGNIALTKNGSLVNFLDANGVTRDVTLPPLEEGRFYNISNCGTVGNIQVRSDDGILHITLAPGDASLIFSSDFEWMFLPSNSTLLNVFTNTVNGIVPAPHSAPPGSLFLRDDGEWAQVQVTGIVDSFKYITDGVNTATGSGPDTFKLRSSSGKIGITVTNNEAIHGDNANFTVNESAIDHNALLNFVANKHIDHTGVTLTAGLGLTGGGDISASRTFDFAPSELTIAAPVLSDLVVFDLAAGGPRRATFTTLNSILVHDNLSGYVADRHIAHSGVSIIAGTGLTGGGDITTSRTLALDINGLTSDTPAVGDFIPFYDISGVDTNKATFSTVNAILDHNALLNYVANQHIDHTTVSINAGSGLTGGGTIAATRTLAIDFTHANTWSGQQTFVAPVLGTATGTSLSLSGSMTASSFSGSGASLTSIPTTALTGTLQAAQEPAHTGDVTNTAGSLALTLATTQGAVHTWSTTQTFTVAPVFTDQASSRSALGLGSIATQSASSVAITGGTIAGLTGLAVRDTSAAFDVTLAAVSSTTLTAGRTLTVDVGNVAHTLKFGTTANTITFPNLSSYTVITNGDTGTVSNAMLANSSLTVNGTSISLGGSATVTAAAGTLTGSTLAAGVTSSSLTVVGTIGTGVWQGTAVTAGFGGTGLTSYAVGDLLYASGSTTLSKLADVATGNALISGGLTTAPSWGKIGLTTHVSGTLPIANGGTNATANPVIAVFLSGDQTAVATATFTKVQFNSEGIDLNNNFDSTTNYRFTPTVAGKYPVLAQLTVLTLTDGKVVGIAIYKNGSIYKFATQLPGATGDATAEIFTVVDMNGTTDYLELFGYHENGSNRDFRGGSTYTNFYAWRVPA